MNRNKLDAIQMTRFGSALCVALLSTVCIVHSTFADDDDIVNSFGFEPTPPPVGGTTFFTTGSFGTAPVPGQLEGQVNPAGEGQAGISPGQWLRTRGTGASQAVVQSTVFRSGGGNQAVKVDRAANSDQRWAVPVICFRRSSAIRVAAPSRQAGFSWRSWPNRQDCRTDANRLSGCSRG